MGPVIRVLTLTEATHFLNDSHKLKEEFAKGVNHSEELFPLNS